MKKITTLLITFICILMLAACNGGDSKNNLAGKSGDDILAAAQAAMESIESFDGKIDTQVDITMAGESLNMSMEGVMSFMMNPMAYSMDLTVKESGNEEQALVYGVQDGDSYKVYSKTGDGSWESSEVSQAEFSVLLDTYGTTAVNAYTRSLTNVTKGNTETINDRSAIKLTAVMSVDGIREAMDTTGLMEGFAAQFLDGSFGDLISVPIDIWVDEETSHILRVRIEMSDFMQDMLNTLMGTLSAYLDDEDDGAYQMQVGTLYLQIDFMNINGVTNIDIPEEAVQ